MCVCCVLADHSIFDGLSKVVQLLIPQLPTLENMLNALISVRFLWRSSTWRFRCCEFPVGVFYFIYFRVVLLQQTHDAGKHAPCSHVETPRHTPRDHVSTGTDTMQMRLFF